MGETLVLADLHLSEDAPEITQRLLALEPRLRQADAVYFLGDVFEAWIGDDAPVPPTLQPVMDMLQRLSQSGVMLHFQPGNRDFLFGAQWGKRLNMRILPDVFVTTLYGQRLALLHGDTLCTDDHAYQAMRRKLRNPFSLFLLRHLPLGLRQRLAAKLRARSKQEIRAKNAAIMDVNLDAVTQVMQSTQVSVLIHGHTHRPAIHHLPNGDLRVVLGDWAHGASVLSLSAQGLQLEYVDAQSQRELERVCWPV